MGRRSVFRTPLDDAPSRPRASSRCRGAFPPGSSGDEDGAVGASVVPDGGVPTAQPPLAGEEGGEEGRLPNPARLHPLALAILLFPVVGRAVPSPYRYPARDPVEQHVDDLPERDDARSEGCVLGHHHHIVVNMMMGGGRGRDAGGEGGRGTTTLMAVWSIAIVM